MLRTTLVDDASAALVEANFTLPMVDNEDDLYETNIQIAELNALNAALAVILFKKHYRYYVSRQPDYNLYFKLEALKITSQSLV